MGTPRCGVRSVQRADSALLHRRDPHDRQWKTQPQFVLEINLYMVQTVLLELHATEVKNIGRMPIHFLQHELHFGLRNHLLLVDANNARTLLEVSGSTAPARPDAKPHAG